MIIFIRTFTMTSTRLLKLKLGLSMLDKIELSNHARIQARRRNFTDDDINFLVKNARSKRATGAIFFQMYKKDMPDDIPPNDRRQKLVGATVLTCKCKRFVITMYKNPNAFKRDSKKKKYDSRNSVHSCPYCCEQQHIM